MISKQDTQIINLMGCKQILQYIKDNNGRCTAGKVRSFAELMGKEELLNSLKKIGAIDVVGESRSAIYVLTEIGKSLLEEYENY